MNMTTQDRRSVVALAACVVAVLALSAGVVDGQPAWECLVCEDVMQTWHDHFRCAGEYLQWGDPVNPDIKSCQGPRFDCNRLKGNLKDTCKGMWEQFTQQVDLTRKIWEGMYITGETYQTCVNLGKCSPLAQEVKNSNDTMTCFHMFKDESCQHDPSCKGFVKHCTQDCYLCNWLVKGFPLFEEACKPKGVTLNASIPLASDINPGSSLLSTRESVRAHARLRERVRTKVAAREAARNKRNGKSQGTLQAPGKMDGAAKPLVTGYTLPNKCFAMWNELRYSKKMRFFASWKRYVNIMSGPIDRLTGKMWDANVACKCIGKCPLNLFEDLGLTETCRYDEADEKLMHYALQKEAMVNQ